MIITPLIYFVGYSDWRKKTVTSDRYNSKKNPGTIVHTYCKIRTSNLAVGTADVNIVYTGMRGTMQYEIRFSNIAVVGNVFNQLNVQSFLVTKLTLAARRLDFY